MKTSLKFGSVALFISLATTQLALAVGGVCSKAGQACGEGTLKGTWVTCGDAGQSLGHSCCCQLPNGMIVPPSQTVLPTTKKTK